MLPAVARPVQADLTVTVEVVKVDEFAVDSP